MKTFSKRSGSEQKKEVECAVCGSSIRIKKWDLGSFVFYQCPVCKLYYQYPQPIQKDLTNRYDEEYFSYEIMNERKFYKLMELTLRDIHFNRDTAVLMGDEPFYFLDIGCATGMLLEHIRESGWNVKGVEICSASAEYGRKKRGLEIYNGTFEEAAYEDEMFSVVHSSHLIEHLTDPAGFVREAFRVLKPGGLFITTTPNTASFQAMITGKEWRSAIADHMYLFSLKNLKMLIKAGGFSVYAQKTWGGIPSGRTPALIKKSADFLAKFFGFGDVMVVAARKPGHF